MKKRTRIVDDIVAFSGNSKKQQIITLFTNPCFHSLCIYRLSHYLYQRNLGIFSKVLWYLNRFLFHQDIDYRCNLDGGFVIKHGLGLVIGKNVETHGSVTVYQGVTLGGTGRTREYNGRILDQPILLDGCVVYSGAKVLGPIIIGRNNKIKAGSVISEDMPGI